MTTDDRNVVLLCLDSVREDVFRRRATRLRGRADIVYTECRAASGWSVPSHASMLTGDLPSEHGIHVHQQDFSELNSTETFLHDLPHYTFGVSANTYASSAFGFDTLFDRYTNVSPNRRFPKGMDVARFGKFNDATGVQKYVAYLRAALKHDHPVLSLLNGAFDRLDEWAVDAPIPKPFDDGAKIITREFERSVDISPEPFIGFANLMDAHSPYHHVYGYNRDFHNASNTWSSSRYDNHTVNTADDITPFREDLSTTRGVYSAAVDYLDRTLDSLVDNLLVETDCKTTIVVTADHGENLGFDDDGGLVGHRGSLSEGLLHVPLIIINAPDDLGVVNERVSHLSLPRLLVGLATGTHPDVTDDVVRAERVGSLLPRDIDPDSDAGRYWNRMIRVVYDTEWKHEWDSEGGSALHRLNSEHPNWQEATEESINTDKLDQIHFRTPLEQYKREARANESVPDVDEATLSRLEDLGYVQ